MPNISQKCLGQAANQQPEHHKQAKLPDWDADQQWMCPNRSENQHENFIECQIIRNPTKKA